MIKIIDRFDDCIGLNSYTAYIASLEVHSIPVNIYIDEPGQCYFFTYAKNGEILKDCCGTYNEDFINYIIWRLDKKGAYLYRYSKKDWEDLMILRKQRGLENIDTDDYDIYTYEEINQIYSYINDLNGDFNESM